MANVDIGIDRIETATGSLRPVVMGVVSLFSRNSWNHLQVHWNRAAASRMLKVSYKTLLHKIVDCGRTPPPGRQSASPRAAGPSR